MYNNALVSDFGLYNGLSQSVTSLGRCLFPVVAGSLFSLGVSSDESEVSSSLKSSTPSRRSWSA